MFLLCDECGDSLYVAIVAPVRSVARSVVAEETERKPNSCEYFANMKKSYTFASVIYKTHTQTLIIMKKFFALLFSVALFAVGCEGGFDISGLLKDYLPDPVSGVGIFEVDEEGNYIISPDGANLNIELKDVKSYLDLDLVSEFKIEISEEAQEWVHVSNLDDIAEGTLMVVVDENTTGEKRYASIKLAPVDNDFLNYTVKLVQVYKGYVLPEEPGNEVADEADIAFGRPGEGSTR